jgi:hypothetical protein
LLRVMVLVHFRGIGTPAPKIVKDGVRQCELIDFTPLPPPSTLANEQLFIPVRGQLDSSLRLYRYQAVQAARQIHRQPQATRNSSH